MINIADEHITTSLDLNALVIQHPAATFFVRASGDAMVGAGIHSGDLLVIDRSLTPTSGKLVVAIVEGEFVVRRLSIEAGNVTLISDSTSITPAEECQIWGVVTYVLHKAE